MRLTDDQAFQIYEKACNLFTWREHPLTPRETDELLWGTDRMQRRILHLLRRAEKKRAKHTKAERVKHMRNMRPIVRLTPAEFVPHKWGLKWKEPFTLVISVGNDAEVYENERMLREAEAQELREDEYDNFLYEEARDAEQVLLDDDFGDRWWEYENDPEDHDDYSDDDFGDP